MNRAGTAGRTLNPAEWWRRRRIERAALQTVGGCELLERDWTFVPGRPSLGVRAIRAYGLATGLRRAPEHITLKPLTEAPAWCAFFAYCPDGRQTAAQAFTLDRLRALGRKVLVVCAAPTARDVPEPLTAAADALIWKALPGFDFSAYGIALRAIARSSPGSDAFVMNDSVLGPLVDPRPALAAAPWAFTGFTAFSHVENHIQSYAFQMRGVTERRVASLGSVLLKRRAFDGYRDVIYLQETRFARVVARRMSAGAFWFADERRSGDPTVFNALALSEAGFPFLKRSLFGRNRSVHPQQALDAILAEAGHPPAEAARLS